jgi:hypothetical protein
MLVSALMGLDTMQSAYRHAISEGYRFCSYGDSSLLLPIDCGHFCDAAAYGIASHSC